MQKAVSPSRRTLCENVHANKMTEFEKRVYNVVKKIPCGKVLTYKQVAVKLDNAGFARAVGNALNKNRDEEVPCHRVIRSDGEVGGYAHGTDKKMVILKKEGIKIKNSSVVI